ncbi:hypothetical protein BT63DRAFT_457158 [Microthyrium microscopicum]|uniref:Uncharacterized protein n=1 Tax=Microthyrium microscopicum TaxID=703497 RepID=A0A6A6U6H8_9PEZI|nr:hypothetical protein BT63DRAFT_457158 [Microthyrium microscopicum]
MLVKSLVCFLALSIAVDAVAIDLREHHKSQDGRRGHIRRQYSDSYPIASPLDTFIAPIASSVAVYAYSSTNILAPPIDTSLPWSTGNTIWSAVITNSPVSPAGGADLNTPLASSSFIPDPPPPVESSPVPSSPSGNDPQQLPPISATLNTPPVVTAGSTSGFVTIVTIQPSPPPGSISPAILPPGASSNSQVLPPIVTNQPNLLPSGSDPSPSPQASVNPELALTGTPPIATNQPSSPLIGRDPTSSPPGSINNPYVPGTASNSPILPPAGTSQPSPPPRGSSPNTPTGGGNGPEPTGSGNDPKPTGGGNDPTPPSGGNDPTPPGGGNDPKPTGGGNDPKPTGGGNDPKPTGGGNDPKPTGGGNDPTPPSGGNDPTPPGGGNDPKPTGGGNDPKPTGGGNDPKPTGGGNDPKPTAGGNDPKPTAGGNDPKPPGGSNPNPPTGSLATPPPSTNTSEKPCAATDTATECKVACSTVTTTNLGGTATSSEACSTTCNTQVACTATNSATSTTSGSCIKPTLGSVQNVDELKEDATFTASAPTTSSTIDPVQSDPNKCHVHVEQILWQDTSKPDTSLDVWATDKGSDDRNSGVKDVNWGGTFELSTKLGQSIVITAQNNTDQKAGESPFGRELQLLSVLEFSVPSERFISNTPACATTPWTDKQDPHDPGHSPTRDIDCNFDCPTTGPVSLVKRLAHIFRSNLRRTFRRLFRRADGDVPTDIDQKKAYYAERGQKYYKAWNDRPTTEPDARSICDLNQFPDNTIQLGKATGKLKALLAEEGISPTESYFRLYNAKTNAEFSNSISVADGAFIAVANDRDIGSTGKPVDEQFSQVAWEQWVKTVLTANPSATDFSLLKTMWRRNISNQQTVDIISIAFKGRPEVSETIVFTPSDQSLDNLFWALLGTPNGNGMQYFLGDNKRKMKGKGITSLKVRRTDTGGKLPNGNTAWEYNIWTVFGPVDPAWANLE